MDAAAGGSDSAAAAECIVPDCNIVRERQLLVVTLLFMSSVISGYECGGWDGWLAGMEVTRSV